MSNADSVLGQLQSAGLVVQWPLAIGKLTRCKVDSDKGGKKSGWYVVHEFRMSGGDIALVGRFGNYKLHGPEGSEKIEVSAQFSEEERRRYAEQMAAAARESEAERKRAADEAADRAEKSWRGLPDGGASEYLTRKKVRAFGVKFARGVVVVPLRNITGKLVGLQYIGGDGGKKFITGTAKSGAFHVLGSLENHGDGAGTIAFAEGYATAASIHMALGNVPVVVCFDCANLVRVVALFREKYSNPFWICGDDDVATEGNPGRAAAERAARESSGVVMLPVFSGGVSGTDWNDLHVESGLAAVREQLLAPVPVSAPAEASRTHPAESAPEAVQPAEKPSVAPLTSTGDAGDEWNAAKLLQRFAMIYGETKVFDIHRQQVMKFAALAGLVGKKLADGWKNDPAKKQIDPEDVEQLLTAKGAGGKVKGLVERYVLLHGTSQAWDVQDKKYMPQSALKMALGSSYQIWENSPERRVIRAENLVFDPMQKADPATHINTFTGLPMKPAESPEKAQPILDLLFWLVNDDRDAYDWIVKWLALPLQQVGAKMRTAILMHGVQQGAGKSLFFGEIHRRIYGNEYSAVVGQHQLDGSYTEWRSRMLFCLFEEIFSNATKYSHMGTVKHMITGPTQRIEKKFASGWEEKNHMNVVFLSNENQPLPVEPMDRRLLVIWPDRKLDPAVTERIKAVLDDGGVEAWYRYLLDIDLTGFDEHTEPPMTSAKQRLIDYGLPSWEVFRRDWQAGRLRYPYISCKTEQLYAAYKQWCHDSGEGSVLSRNKLTAIFVPYLRRKENVHYLSGAGSKKATFFVVGEPEDETAEKWFGKCVEEFERSLSTNA